MVETVFAKSSGAGICAICVIRISGPEALKTINTLLKSDLIKIISSLGIGEVVYTIVRWTLQYYFLQINYEPYMASIVSQSISLVIYMITLNLSVKLTKLYKDGS